MIYKNVELHNIEEVGSVEGAAGARLQRVPESVRFNLNVGAQAQMLSPACAEIRFVTTGPSVNITLSSDGQTQVVVFHGVFQSPERHVIGEQPKTLNIAMPQTLSMLNADFRRRMPFAPNVCRLMLWGNPLYFHGIEGDGIRPPNPDELPRLRYLAYGTSITHGGAATGPHLAYAAQTARRLGVDLINLGVSGSCYCEHRLANYIAWRKDWHFATFCLSVNMMGAGFSLETFYERVSYMINTVAGADTNRPVACITVFPHTRDFDGRFVAKTDKGTTEEYRQKLRDAVAACPYPNAHLIEGASLLADIGGLTPDLVHPADNGMIQMGENLAAALKPLMLGL